MNAKEFKKQLNEFLKNKEKENNASGLKSKVGYFESSDGIFLSFDKAEAEDIFKTVKIVRPYATIIEDNVTEDLWDTIRYRSQLYC